MIAAFSQSLLFCVLVALSAQPARHSLPFITFDLGFVFGLLSKSSVSAIEYIQRMLPWELKNLVDFPTKALQRWLYNRAYFPQLGLMRDDVVVEDPDVKEALRRLPANLMDERQFRMMRAIHLSSTKTILPQSEWMTLEKDVKYLQPYLKEVIKEREERERWFKQ